ncbi:hypothetical protein N7447_002493 [Penicillium robsamsonii]|uniref:uncharacterized protein n=1 Tax=Penicillium robsamsonii TaxID=1792511 RepID=UPI00254980B2|nr:uncharacterized protein N7447_002493 [Penicillium robsamsonii]KAJ5836467.1 hypothetical protein N7447_002493 [Penicillium robsamsonii]
MSFFTNPPRRGRNDTDDRLYPRLYTQATELPRESTMALLNITRLKPESSLTVWGNEILHVLRPHKLDAPVASDLPKPHQEDSDYSKWKFWTLYVAGWLFNQVDTSIQHKVKVYSNDLDFADEIFNTIKLLSLHSQSKFLANEVKRWQQLKRENFSTPAEFIMAYQNQHNRLKTEDHAPSCDFALGRLLHELHREAMKVPFIQEEVKDLGRSVDYRLFVYYCKVLVDESGRPTVSAGPSTPEASGEGIHGELRG